MTVAVDPIHLNQAALEHARDHVWEIGDMGGNDLGRKRQKVFGRIASSISVFSA
jgi:hypothetical protein